MVKPSSSSKAFAVRIYIADVIVRGFLLLEKMSHLRKASMTRYDTGVKTHVKYKARNDFFILKYI